MNWETFFWALRGFIIVFVAVALFWGMVTLLTSLTGSDTAGILISLAVFAVGVSAVYGVIDS